MKNIMEFEKEWDFLDCSVFLFLNNFSKNAINNNL